MGRRSPKTQLPSSREAPSTREASNYNPQARSLKLRASSFPDAWCLEILLWGLGGSRRPDTATSNLQGGSKHQGSRKLQTSSCKHQGSIKLQPESAIFEASSL